VSLSRNESLTYLLQGHCTKVTMSWKRGLKRWIKTVNKSFVWREEFLVSVWRQPAMDCDESHQVDSSKILDRWQRWWGRPRLSDGSPAWRDWLKMLSADDAVVRSSRLCEWRFSGRSERTRISVTSLDSHITHYVCCLMFDTSDIFWIKTCQLNVGCGK